MTQWASGYNAESGYTYDYFREYEPDRLQFICKMYGINAPKLNGSYLELGCGQGLGLAMMACVFPETNFVGVDFHPEHIGNANQIKQRLGLTNINFIEGDFLELQDHWPGNLGTFDFVLLHGIISWVSPEVFASIINILSKCTHPDSLIATSYNAYPRRLSGHIIQKLLRQTQVSKNLSGADTLQAGKKLFTDLQEAGSRTLNDFTNTNDYIAKISDSNEIYLQQEYLNDNWTPYWSSDVHNKFAAAKLSFIGHVGFGEFITPNLLDEKQRSLITAEQDPGMKESLFDIILNRGFRRDLFSKGSRKLWELDKKDDLLKIKVMKTGKQNQENFSITSSVGKISFKAKAYKAFISKIDDEGCALKDVWDRCTTEFSDFESFIQAALILLETDHICFSRSLSRNDAHYVNSKILSMTERGAPFSYLIELETNRICKLDILDMLAISELNISHSMKTLEEKAESVKTKLVQLGKTINDSYLLNNKEGKQGDLIKRWLIENNQRLMFLAQKFLLPHFKS